MGLTFFARGHLRNPPALGRGWFRPHHSSLRDVSYHLIYFVIGLDIGLAV